jgi:hypothetical protein
MNEVISKLRLGQASPSMFYPPRRDGGSCLPAYGGAKGDQGLSRPFLEFFEIGSNK